MSASPSHRLLDVSSDCGGVVCDMPTEREVETSAGGPEHFAVAGRFGAPWVEGLVGDRRYRLVKVTQGDAKGYAGCGACRGICGWRGMRGQICVLELIREH